MGIVHVRMIFKVKIYTVKMIYQLFCKQIFIHILKPFLIC